jgi:cell shape-determining protein MreC
MALLSINRPADSLIKPSNVLERGMLIILQPFQNAVSHIISQIQHIWQRYIALIHLSEENQQLREEVKRLRAEKNRYIEGGLAYERLKGTLHFVEERQFSTILARVIGHDPTNQTNTIIVNRGTEHGVKESWPVITQDGIVGFTVNVSTKSSKILLLIDPNCNVASLIQRTRDQGIVGGQSKKDAYIMKYVNRRANIREGIIFRITDQSLVELAKEDIPGFQLTEYVFSKLQEENVPADILTILEELKEYHYVNQETFVKALETTLGRDQANWYKSMILPYAKTDVLAQLEALKNQVYETETTFLDALEMLIGKEATEQYFSTIVKHAHEEELVVSSGLGGIFPKGLIVGTVSKILKQDYGLFQQIEVTPSVDFSKLEEVLIIRREEIVATQ